MRVYFAQDTTYGCVVGEPGKPGKFDAVLKRTADFLVDQKTIRSAPALAAFDKGIDSSALAKALA